MPQEQIAHLLLPRLKTGNAGVQAPPPGAWDDGQAATRLHNLAYGIEVPPTATSVHSVPDPWARVILFDRALYDENHSLYPEVMGEWRGLLAILGLRKRMHFISLDSVPVTLKADEGRPGYFTSVLSRLLPDKAGLISSDTSWSNFNILRWQVGDKKRAFALTSPTTLVATGADYSNVLDKDEVQWFVNGKLRDPRPYLSEPEKRDLAEWLLWIKSNFKGVENSTRRERILELLGKFAIDLDPGAQSKGEDLVLDKDDLKLGSGIYQFLSRPHVPETSKFSEVQIVPSEEKKNAPVYLLVEPDLARQWNTEAKNIVVHRDITLATAKSQLLAKAKPNARSGSLGEVGREVYWCTSSFFFQEHLIYAQNLLLRSSATVSKDQLAFPGCLPFNVQGDAKGRQIVLPLNEAVADLFTPTYLAKNFTITWQQDGSAKCTLRLQVRSAAESEVPGPGDGASIIGSVGTGDRAGSPSTAEVTRWVTLEYTYNDGKATAGQPSSAASSNTGKLVHVDPLPAVGVWPDFQFEDDKTGNNRWKRYYLFESWRGIGKPEIFAVRPLSRSGETMRITQGADIFQVHTMERFPEFLVCQMPRVDASYVDDDNELPKGLLALRTPEKQATGVTRGAALGVDFGTTGTVVYHSWPGEDAEALPIELKDRLLRITGTDSNELKRIGLQEFLPAQPWQTNNILSVYQEFNTPTGPEKRQSLLDGHVLFCDQLSTFIQGDDKFIRSNLKWGGSDENGAARGFLSQLCLQSMAELICEGANKIDVRYSYPTAFSAEDEELWQGIWRQGVIKYLKTSTSIPVSLNETNVENREAIAATRFFTTYTGNPLQMAITRGAITIDIGGGTSDLAIWNYDENERKPRLMAHLSLLFAGRDMFLAPLRARPSLLTDLYSDIPLHTLKDKKKDAMKAQLDALIAIHGAAMLEEIPNKSQEPSVRAFIQILELGLSGLAFYAGLLVGRLAELNTWKPGVSIPVFIGGNGSKLFHWCAQGNFTDRSSFQQRFGASLLAGCKVGYPQFPTTKVQVVLSSLPKQEVAYGLVMPATNLKIDNQFVEPMAGEDFEVLSPAAGKERLHPWSDTMDKDLYADSPIHVAPDLPTFQKFLQSVNLMLDAATLENLSGMVDADLEKLTNRPQPEGTLSDASDQAVRKDPIFIMALKHLLQTRINKW